jgi:glutaredoxin
LNTQVLGISIDHVPVLKAWAESLGGINYPLLSDFWPHGEVASRYGAFRELDGFSERAIFIIDAEGILRYIDIHDIDDQPDNEVLFAELKKISPDVVPDSEPGEEALAELPQGGIVMYCDEWCPDCKLARAWLKRHKLAYREVDVTNTPGASAQIRKWADGNMVTPVFDIDGTIVLDFDVARLREVLKDQLK